MVQPKANDEKSSTTDFVLLQLHRSSSEIIYKAFGLYSTEEEAYAAATIKQMQSIEESSKKWPKSVVEEHWQEIQSLYKHIKEELSSFKDRFNHLLTLKLFQEQCPVSYKVLPLRTNASDSKTLLNESIFKTKARNLIDALQPKIDEEVDLDNSDDDDDEEEEEEEEDEVDEEEEEEEGEEEEEEEEVLDESNNEEEDSGEESDENEGEVAADEDDEEDIEDTEGEEEDDDEENAQNENTIPETEEEDQMNGDEGSDDGEEEQPNRGIKRSRTEAEDEEEDEIDEDELVDDEDEPSNTQKDLSEQNNGIMTPPMSPVNGSMDSHRHSANVVAGQTGLLWLARDAEGDHFHPHQQQESPPPKLSAKPAFTVRIPTRKRVIQRHTYRMKDGLDPMNLFRRIKNVEVTTGKGYRRIDAKFMIPSKIQDQFKSSNGVQDAWMAFRQFARENSLIHQDFVDFIENEMIPTLSLMLKDMHHFMQSLLYDKNLKTASLYDYRKKADKMLTRLNTEIYNLASNREDSIKSGKGPYLIPKKDPLLTKYAVMNTIADLYKHENHLHKSFLEVQDKYRQFEQAKIINVYTSLFQRFEAYRSEHGLERSEGVSKIVNIFNAIEADSEWYEFFHHHDNELVKPSAAFKDEHVLEFPNESHPLVQPLIMGDIKRKVGSSKWHNEYYILSPVGVLYCFNSEKDFYCRPYQYKFSIFVPKSNLLVNPESQLIEFTGKSLGLFGKKKTLHMTTTNPQDITHWMSVMGPIANYQQLVPSNQDPAANTDINNHQVDTTTPVVDNNASSIQSKKEEGKSSVDTTQNDQNEQPAGFDGQSPILSKGDLVEEHEPTAEQPDVPASNSNVDAVTDKNHTKEQAPQKQESDILYDTHT
ncbi:hypothetical protein BCV71DRAFT_206702 [Rhizopus microsporus]|uniref:PH domain-containing protein n=1 Tax=Rhizopus microsporus TaxID=58291 RepID=A0A1X0RM97_RHIZD|nr:hypothetical protein BCV71DRAFT_206702 [Rhizopus microsporus]